MKLARGSAVWARRGLLAAVLIGAAVVPGRAVSAPAGACAAGHCPRHAGTIRWTRRLPGSWVAQGGAIGTVPAVGQAYAAVGGGLAAVGFGQTVAAYELSTGAPAWTASLADFPDGSAVSSVRAWAGVITAGVSVPDAGGGSHRDEVVLSAASGQRLRVFPAATYGGAVSATAQRTVIVGNAAVTSYANATGRVAWRVATGRVAQAWRVSGRYLYVTVSAGGFLGADPVTALRRIDLATGAETVLRDRGLPFDGTLAGAAGGSVLFSGPDGLAAYSGTSGRLLWRRAGVVPEGVDAVRQVLYVASGNSLTGLNPATGRVITSAAALGAAGLYAVSGGVALGLDQGGLGDAWGYDLAARRVTWTARAVPWPHFFVDLSGLGGSAGLDGAAAASADPSGADRSGVGLSGAGPGGSGSVILAACARLGPAPAIGAPLCLRPELVAVGP